MIFPTRVTVYIRVFFVGRSRIPVPLLCGYQHCHGVFELSRVDAEDLFVCVTIIPTFGIDEELLLTKRSSPCNLNITLEPNRQDDCSNPFASLMGSLQYPATATGLDIAYAVNRLSVFMVKQSKIR